ncbi:MAG: SMP-30/gluconolactonase/LRE family protein [Steroidobacteraceae bacterium]|nr:SMP-30/gluconolactonase/LRE family protein [Steroidobacteraceae bacterium]MBP7014284.1 SMP-30/gluconolactonase/LRE family protein [Steroidobacteraceae bacterium]
MGGILRGLTVRAEAGFYSLLPSTAGISSWQPVAVESVVAAFDLLSDTPRGAVRGDLPGQALALECVLGEGPLWDSVRGVMYWLDISRRRLHAYRLATRETRSHWLPAIPGAVATCADSRLLVATSRGFGHYDPDTGSLDFIPGTAPGWPTRRFNDGRCDRAGRFWTGTMRLRGDAHREGLFRFESGRDLARVDDGFTVCNGLDWSPDDGVLYLVDTAASRVYAYDFDVVSGTVANRRVFVDTSNIEGRPDGLVVDAEGGVWVAIAGGWQLRRYGPDGRAERTLRLPVPRPTSCAFGGPALDTLYITSSRLGLSSRELAAAPLSGCLFAFDVGLAGSPVRKFSN